MPSLNTILIYAFLSIASAFPVSAVPPFMKGEVAVPDGLTPENALPKAINCSGFYDFNSTLKNLQDNKAVQNLTQQCQNSDTRPICDALFSVLFVMCKRMIDFTTLHAPDAGQHVCTIAAQLKKLDLSGDFPYLQLADQDSSDFAHLMVDYPVVCKVTCAGARQPLCTLLVKAILHAIDADLVSEAAHPPGPIDGETAKSQQQNQEPGNEQKKDTPPGDEQKKDTLPGDEQKKGTLPGKSTHPTESSSVKPPTVQSPETSENTKKTESGAADTTISSSPKPPSTSSRASTTITNRSTKNNSATSSQQVLGQDPSKALPHAVATTTVPTSNSVETPVEATQKKDKSTTASDSSSQGSSPGIKTNEEENLDAGNEDNAGSYNDGDGFNGDGGIVEGDSKEMQKPPEGPGEDSSKLMPDTNQMPPGIPVQEDSHFFVYFLMIVAICILSYLVFHNKQKIIALIIEGRHERRRRPSTGSYKKLDVHGEGKDSHSVF